MITSSDFFEICSRYCTRRVVIMLHTIVLFIVIFWPLLASFIEFKAFQSLLSMQYNNLRSYLHSLLPIKAFSEFLWVFDTDLLPLHVELNLITPKGNQTWVFFSICSIHSNGIAQLNNRNILTITLLSHIVQFTPSSLVYMCTIVCGVCIKCI